MKSVVNLRQVIKAGVYIILLCLPLLTMAQRTKRLAGQKAKSAEQRAKMATDAMKTSCNLSDDQYKQVYQVNLDFVNRAAALRSDTDDQMVKMGKMKLADDERDHALKDILDNHQFKAFQSWKQERRKNPRFNQG